MTDLFIHLAFLVGIVQLLLALGLGKKEKHHTLLYRRRSALFASIIFSIPMMVESNICWCQLVMYLFFGISIVLSIVLFRQSKKSL